MEQKIFSVRNFRLQSGVTLAELELAYEIYGTLATDKRNAVLVTHGFTSSHHAAGRYVPSDPQPGWWDRAIGPGKAFDTDRYFVLCSNMLGSCYGSTGPASIDPSTGKPYGPDFPRISVADMVTAQRALLASLGIEHLVAVAGPSYGGILAFQWGVTFPGFMDGLLIATSAPKNSEGQVAVERLRAQLAADSNWNGGWYYENGGIGATLTKLRVATLKIYGLEARLETAIPDPESRRVALENMAADWARGFDGNSLLTLRQALVQYDTVADFAKIKAKVLYVLCSSDAVFPTTLAANVMAKLKAAGVDATYFELESEHGHLATSSDADKWTPALRTFLKRLES